jgi:predicted restriction endonuclease
MTGLQHPELLVASHIVAWKDDSSNRLNPTNGLCLNALHDKAFDRALITVDADSYCVRVSSALKGVRLFTGLDAKSIILPDKFLPEQTFLARHNLLFRG